MKAASASELKQELKRITSTQLVEICLRLARYKKENKELITYLLFEADDEGAYIEGIRKEIEDSFEEINTSNLYFAKKSLRKILRTTNKYIRFAGSKTTEAELLIHYCKTLKGSKIQFRKSPALLNLYLGQIKKINKAVDTMHEDLQYDYLREIEQLNDTK